MVIDKSNLKERMKFVEYWAEYVRTHDDKDWSRQQNIIINSGLIGNKMTAEEFLKMKGEWRGKDGPGEARAAVKKRVETKRSPPN